MEHKVKRVTIVQKRFVKIGALPIDNQPNCKNPNFGSWDANLHQNTWLIVVYATWMIKGLEYMSSTNERDLLLLIM